MKPRSLLIGEKEKNESTDENGQRTNLEELVKKNLVSENLTEMKFSFFLLVDSERDEPQRMKD